MSRHEAAGAERWHAAALGFVRDLERGRAADAAARVSPDVPAGALAGDRLAQVWTQLTGQLGRLASLEPYAVDDDGRRRTVDLAARFARSEVTLRVVLDDDARVTGFWVRAPRPPAYEPPPYVDTAAFEERELAIGASPALPAVLALPTHGGPAPVVVLVHGSGPNDRDERLGGHRPFRDLAWGLASRGVASLRYDKRTHAHPGSLPRDLSVEHEVIADALAALQAAREADGVDAGQVFLLGHSLGARLAPEIAERDGRVAGVAMLAASARPSAVVLAEQLTYLESLARAAGQPADLPTAIALRQLEQLARRDVPPEAEVLGVTAAYWYDLDERRPLERARRLAAPLLLLFGGRDYQVTGADESIWRDTLAGRVDATVRSYPELDHLFVAGAGRATPAEYATRTGHVAETVVRELASWILDRS